jgi:hypothetical protein
MTEQVPPEGVDPDVRPRTGVPSVDSVLDDLEGLDSTPLAEQQAAFERAHDRLRAALDDPGEAPGDEADARHLPQPPDHPA